jgi:hypothetical protein
VDEIVFLSIAGVLGLLLGLALVAYSVSLHRKEKQFQARACRARGQVVAIEEGPDTVDGGVLLYPVVEFRAPGGRTVEFRHPVGTYPCWYRVGQPVTVLFDPEEPDRARVDSFLSRSFGGLVPGCVGGAFLLLSLVCLLVVLVLGLTSR